MKPNYREIAQLDAALQGGLVVSCQPVDNGPLDNDDTVVRLAQAAVAGGARALRIEGARRVAKVRANVTVPLIGIVKRDMVGFPVRITPCLTDVDALLEAGADVIAVDATQRARPCPQQDLLARIHAGGAIAMADCASLEEGLAAAAMGFEIVGSTLAGYTGTEVPDLPDYELLAALTQRLGRVMAEGRYNTPEQVRQAAQLGAWAVTVGTAITRTEVITQWFSASLMQEQTLKAAP
ncbi:MAG: putative N-acetylmannosamine-6-phosphate 2-epimerase [Rhodoferax sp.]|nr:putative N-acetylmannosamine-6-phosphate 2-epimerase [Rhodoferax sp.]